MGPAGGCMAFLAALSLKEANTGRVAAARIACKADKSQVVKGQMRQPGASACFTHSGADRSIVAVDLFLALMTFLSLKREGRNRPGVEAADANRLAGFLAIPVLAGVDAAEG